jgi:hypothetical protein
MSLSSSPHLRGIVIAGGLAVVALLLAYVTLGMNQSASTAAPATIVPLKDRHPSSARPASSLAAAHAKAAAKPKARARARERVRPKPLDPNTVAALKAGLPRSLANALAARAVAVVALTSSEDSVDEMAAQEARSGAALAGASYVAVSVDRNGGDASTLTRVLGTLPSAPAVLVYERPSTLYTTLVGFNDSTTVQQAASSALVAYRVAHPKTAAAKAAVTAEAAQHTWTQAATAACTSTSREFAGVLKQALASGDASHVQPQFDSLSERFLTSMRALKAPPGKAAQVARLNAMLQQFFAAIDEEMAAEIRHDAPGVAAAQARGKVIVQEENKVAVSLGAPACGGWVS